MEISQLLTTWGLTSILTIAQIIGLPNKNNQVLAECSFLGVTCNLTKEKTAFIEPKNLHFENNLKQKFDIVSNPLNASNFYVFAYKRNDNTVILSPGYLNCISVDCYFQRGQGIVLQGRYIANVRDGSSGNKKIVEVKFVDPGYQLNLTTEGRAFTISNELSAFFIIYTERPTSFWNQIVSTTSSFTNPQLIGFAIKNDAPTVLNFLSETDRFPQNLPSGRNEGVPLYIPEGSEGRAMLICSPKGQPSVPGSIYRIDSIWPGSSYNSCQRFNITW